jgi:hypothetical protein
VELSLHANLPSELVLLFQYHALELGLLADLPSELGLLLFHQKEAAGDFFESRRLRKLLKMRYFQGHSSDGSHHHHSLFLRCRTERS